MSVFFNETTCWYIYQKTIRWTIRATPNTPCHPSTFPLINALTHPFLLTWHFHMLLYLAQDLSVSRLLLTISDINSIQFKIQFKFTLSDITLYLNKDATKWFHWSQDKTGSSFSLSWIKLFKAILEGPIWNSSGVYFIFDDCCNVMNDQNKTEWSCSYC